MTRKCPDCGNRSAVIDSRETDSTVRRIRECIKCRARWTTWEASINPSALEAVREAMTRVKTAARLGERAIEAMQTRGATRHHDSGRRPVTAGSKCRPHATGLRSDSRGRLTNGA